MKSRHLCLLLLLAWGCSKNPDPPAADAAGTPDTGSDMAADAARDDGFPDVGRDDIGGGDAADMVDAGPACTYQPGDVEEIPSPDRIHTPRWAFLPWISKDISDRDDTYAFVDGFLDRDIPVGVVVLDSPWEDNYNTFIPNPERYPDFEQMVTDMGDRGVRVVLWVTQMTNSRSFDAEIGGDTYDGAASNFQEGLDCGFYVNEGEQFFWWKGLGGAIDFFNPTAAQWWHEQQNALLDLGVAGWKLDFGDTYVDVETVRTAAGEVPHQAYSEAYYRDFYEYGIHRNGHEDFVTMVRAWDASYEWEGRFYAKPEHAPVVWVGDNRRDWFGLEDAMDHTFRSAAAGYVVVGSDLGGYLDRDDQQLTTRIPFDRVNFHRWLAMSAMTPFMQLHGRANLTPWSLPDDTNPDESVALYRFWAHLHTELIPFWYSLAEESYAGNADGIIIPLGEEASWPGDYRYMLGEAFLVAPILDETGIRDVEIPTGRWYDWWTGEALDGGITRTEDFSADLQKIPLYVRDGAIVPVESTNDVSGITQGNFGAATTVLVWPSATETSFVLHPALGDAITYTASVGGLGESNITATRADERTIFRVRRDGLTAAVTLNGTPLAPAASDADLASADGYRVDGSYVWISVAASAQAITIRID